MPDFPVSGKKKEIRPDPSLHVYNWFTNQVAKEQIQYFCSRMDQGIGYRSAYITRIIFLAFFYPLSDTNISIYVFQNKSKPVPKDSFFSIWLIKWYTRVIKVVVLFGVPVLGVHWWVLTLPDQPELIILFRKVDLVQINCKILCHKKDLLDFSEKLRKNIQQTFYQNEKCTIIPLLVSFSESYT